MTSPLKFGKAAAASIILVFCLCQGAWGGILGRKVFWLPEPLVSSGVCGSDEDSIVMAAVNASAKQADVKALSQFLEEHPDSCYAPAVALDTALMLKQRGYSYEALQTLRQGWEHARSARSGNALAYANRLGAELAKVEGALGQVTETAAILDAFKDRPVKGEAARALGRPVGARGL